MMDKAISSRLSAHPGEKSILLIVDNAWKTAHALPCQVGGSKCAMVMTTRMNDVAQALAPTPDHIFKIPILSSDASLDLLQHLAPSVVEKKPDEARELIADLEGKVYHSRFKLRVDFFTLKCRWAGVFQICWRNFAQG